MAHSTLGVPARKIALARIFGEGDFRDIVGVEGHSLVDFCPAQHHQLKVGREGMVAQGDDTGLSNRSEAVGGQRHGGGQPGKRLVYHGIGDSLGRGRIGIIGKHRNAITVLTDAVEKSATGRKLSFCLAPW
jgi:hypothetical protein